MKQYTYKEKSELLLEETIDALRNKPWNSSYVECRTRQLEASELYCDLPQPLRMGYCMNYVVENVSCPVAPQDILVGRFPEKIPTPEEEETLFSVNPAKFWGEDRKMFMQDGGHTTLDWEEILRLGMSGYIAKAEDALTRRMAEGAEKERLLFLQGMILVYRSYRRYIQRYAEAAKAAGNEEAAQVCQKLAEGTPTTFLEAMQLVLFVTSIFSIYSAIVNATLCCGRMDDLLFPYYERDVAAGILTREDAGYIIDDFNCKSAIILGRGEHQMSSGDDKCWLRNPMYDSPTYVILGGYSNQRKPEENPLTRLFLERIHPRLENPVYVFRRTAGTPQDMWRLVCDKLRQNSTLIVYNDETEIPSFLHVGVTPEDAVNYTIHGCNWPDIQGKSTMGCRNLPLPFWIMKAVFDENGRPRENICSTNAIFEQIGKDWRIHQREAFQEYRDNAEERKKPNTRLRCEDCFMRGTIEAAANDYTSAPYYFNLTLLRNIGTAADMLAALETVCFGENPVSLDTMADALQANFQGYEDLWKRCKNAPKYGQDDERADGLAVRLFEMLQKICEEETVNPETGVRDIYAPNVTITDMGHIYYGKELGATPDGRLAGTPLSENLSPTVGSTQSVTALLNSVSKLPFDRVSSGTMNLRLPKNLVSGEEGLERLMLLLETYFEDGGMQIQLSVADTQELRDAQLHPEKYPDLMVRITGYSAVFVDMCTTAQNEVIRRDEVS